MAAIAWFIAKMIGVAFAIDLAIVVVLCAVGRVWRSRTVNSEPQPRREQPQSPGRDTINRVILHFDPVLPRYCVYVQLDDGSMVLFGRWVDLERAKFERLALENLLFTGKTTKPPFSFEAQ